MEFLRLIHKSRLALLLIAFLFSITGAGAQAQQDARQLFEQVYQKVFGPQGSTLHYNVNLIGVYRTSGTIWYKGTKSRFSDARIDSWNDGRTVYSVNRRKKVVNIYDASSDDYDKYASKFKFTLDDFTYSMERNDEGIWFTLRQRQGARGTVKLVKALVDAETLTPIHVKVKVTLFWAHIRISNFHSGDINDTLFDFPFSTYSQGYRFLDHR
jgi:hypothetical protein